MAHELELGGVDNRIEAAFACQGAWHGLGTVLPYVPDSEQMIQAAGLDWEVGMNDMEGTVKGGKNDGLRIVSAKKQIIRLDTMQELGVVGANYGIVQNREAFQFLDSLQKDKIMRYESAMALKGGRIVVVVARMPSKSKDKTTTDDKGNDIITPEDTCARYVLFQTSHDGSMKLHALATSVRVVCMNTLRLAIKDMEGLRHVGDMTGKLDGLRNYLSQFDEQFTLFRNKARLLSTKKFTRAEATAYLDTLMPPVAADKAARTKTRYANKRDAINTNYFNSNQKLPQIKGTYWALFNAFTELVDHGDEMTFKGEGCERAENRFMSITSRDGAGADLKDKAWNLALSMAGV